MENFLIFLGSFWFRFYQFYNDCFPFIMIYLNCYICTKYFYQNFVTLFYFLVLFRDFLRVSHYYILLYFDIVFQMFLPTMAHFIATSILQLLCSVNGSVRRFCLCMADVLPYFTPKVHFWCSGVSLGRKRSSIWYALCTLHCMSKQDK